MAVCLISYKLKPLIIFFAGIHISGTANICILVPLYDLFLLFAPFRYVITSIRYLEVYKSLTVVQIENFTNGEENLIVASNFERLTSAANSRGEIVSHY
jgi:hypothetical protein